MNLCTLNISGQLIPEPAIWSVLEQLAGSEFVGWPTSGELANETGNRAANGTGTGQKIWIIQTINISVIDLFTTHSPLKKVGTVDQLMVCHSN